MATPFDPYEDELYPGSGVNPGGAPLEGPPPTDSSEGAYGLSFWNARGYPNEAIFDANGQLRPGWRHIQQGYMYDPPVQPRGTGGAPPPTPRVGMSEQEGRDYDARNGLVGGYMTPQGWVSGSPRSSGGRGGPGGPGGGGMNFAYGGPFMPYPDYDSPGEFRFDPFSPSSWEDAENEPGYRASRTRLREQVEAGAAHRGVLRSGMTLGDIYTNLDALGQQNFAQFDERRRANYGLNRETAHMGYQSRATDVDRRNNYRFNVADATNKDALARWQEQVRSLTQLARPVD